MICAYCNENIKDNASFCPFCGQKQLPTQTAPPPVTPTQTAPPPVAPPQTTPPPVAPPQTTPPPVAPPQTTPPPVPPPKTAPPPLTPQFDQQEPYVETLDSQSSPPQSKQRLAPPNQAQAKEKSGGKLPLMLGVSVLVLGIMGGALHYMNNSNNSSSSPDLPEISTSQPAESINPVALVQQYTHFANRSDITNETVLAYFSQGTWEEPQPFQVCYQGVLNGSQEDITLEYTVDRSTGESTLSSFSIQNLSLGVDFDSRNTFFTQLFQLACSGMDNGETTISSFSLDDLLCQLVKTSEVSQGSYLYYCDLADYLYPDHTWAVTSLSETNHFVDFQGFEGETMVIFSRLLVDTQDASVNMVYFTENQAEYDHEGLAKWAEETSELFLAMMEQGGVIPETPVAPPETVNLSNDQMMALYTEEMARYQSGQEENWSADQYRSAGLPETTTHYTNLNVSFVDFDSNGVPEMIVESGVILAIHTLSNASGTYKPVLLLGDSLQSSISLGNEGYIANTSTSAFESVTTLYQVYGSTLQELDSSAVTTWVEDAYEFTSMSQFLPSEPEEETELSTTPEISPTVDLFAGNESKYGSVLTKVGMALLDEVDENQLRSEDLSLLYQNYGLWDVGYAFLDLNGDGVDELLFGGLYDYSDAFLALYGMVGNTPTLLCNASENDQYILCSDGYIAYLGDNTKEKTFQVTNDGLAEVSDSRSFHHLTNAFVPVYTNLSNYIIE